MRNIPHDMTMRVILTDEAAEQFEQLPKTMKLRVIAITERLANWPEVSGAKALRGDRAGQYRIRTGDWRIVFIVQADVLIIRIDHRSQVYED